MKNIEKKQKKRAIAHIFMYSNLLLRFICRNVVMLQQPCVANCRRKNFNRCI